MMKWLKRSFKVLILLPVMFLVESILLLVIAQVTFFSVDKALVMTEFAVNNLPSMEWYFKE